MTKSTIRTPLYEVLNIEDAESLLVLTYEFQAEALARLFGASKKLPANSPLNRVKPIIIYDGMVTREKQAHQDLLWLHSVSVRAGIHHSKAWCKQTALGLELVLGSFNLTENGLYRNREVYKQYSWSEKDNSGASVISDFLTLIGTNMKSVCNKPGGSHLKEFLENCEVRSRAWARSPGESKLLSNGYSSESGLSQLLGLWKQRMGAEPVKGLIVVSPFFDTSPDDNLLNRLAKDGLINPKTKTTLISSLNRNGIMPMLRTYSEKWQSYKGSRLFVPDVKLIAGDGEWLEVEQHTKDSSSETIRKENVLRRDLHAKIVVLCSENEALSYFGSANFTMNAWTGKNQELGATEWSNAKYELITEGLVKGLNAKPVESWDSVAWAATIDQLINKDEFIEKSGYPHCLRSAVLVKADKDSIRFDITVDPDDKTSILEHQVTWGTDKLSLSATPGSKELFSSQSFSLKGALQLLLQNNLRLIPNADKSKEFFYPILFDEALRDERAQAGFSDSDDWLTRFLFPDKGETDSGPGGTMDGFEVDEDDTTETISLRDHRRDENKTVAMQRYMTQYLQLENAFSAQIARFDDSLDRDSSKQLRFFRDGDPYSFANYLRLLESELTTSVRGLSEPLFKLGEARALLYKAVTTVRNQSLKSELSRELEKTGGALESLKLQRPDIIAKPIFKAYLDMVIGAREQKKL